MSRPALKTKQKYLECPLHLQPNWQSHPHCLPARLKSHRANIWACFSSACRQVNHSSYSVRYYYSYLLFLFESIVSKTIFLCLAPFLLVDDDFASCWRNKRNEFHQDKNLLYVSLSLLLTATVYPRVYHSQLHLQSFYQQQQQNPIAKENKNSRDELACSPVCVYVAYLPF